MSKHITRREFARLASMIGGTTVVGFNLGTRGWVTEAQAQEQPFQDVPRFDGTLLLDAETRTALAVDRGKLFHKMPAAVLRPGSVQDIIKIVQYANQHRLKIAIK